MNQSPDTDLRTTELDFSDPLVELVATTIRDAMLIDNPLAKTNAYAINGNLWQLAKRIREAIAQNYTAPSLGSRLNIFGIYAVCLPYYVSALPEVPAIQAASNPNAVINPVELTNKLVAQIREKVGPLTPK